MEIMNESEIREELVRAIRASDLPPARIASTAGLNRSVLSRLLSGERGLSLASAAALAEALGMELVLRPKPRKGRS
jgi:DNA-binding phage protein